MINMADEKDFELINSKDNTCNSCAFAKEDCPAWAKEKCDGTDKIWQKKEDSEDLTTSQTVALGVFGCLVSIVIVIGCILANAVVTAWILRKFFNF